MAKKLIHIKKVLPKKKKWLFLLFSLPFLTLIAVFYLLILKDLPSPTRLSSNTLPQSTKIYDRNDKLLYTIYSEKNQTFIPLKDIPDDIRHATIAIEDKDFYKHGAIDLRGVIRAAYATLFKKQLQGGSTLTQQLVKTSLLTPDRTIQRKVREVLLSFATEIIYSKDKILEMYLNQVPYGGTAYGVEAAAQTYFGKKAKDLTLAESALLAGLPESPTTYSPFGSRPELARARQKEILRAMESEGYITKKQREEAEKEKIVYRKTTTPILAPHFVLYVKEILVEKYGIQAVEQGGLRVKTSLDLALQETAQASVAAEIDEIARLKVSNGAALITKPGTGEILAMVGSKDYFDESIDGNVNITISKRQPGSSIKPINYATGLVKGFPASTLFIDKQVCFNTPGQPPYCPRNYDGKFRGPVLMRESLANSLNIPAVQMLKMNTLEAMIATASAMGITTFNDIDRYGLSLTLGGGEVYMTDMATAFGVFANGGYRIDLHPILEVKDKTGKILEDYTPPQSPIFGKKVLPAGVAYIISDILSDNNARSQAFGTNSELRIGNNPLSVKTGTTNDLRDNWTIGYSQDYLVAVWVGNSDNSPMSGLVSGVTGAAPIWNDLMSYVIQGQTVPIPKRPVDVVSRTICSNTGFLPVEGAEGCPTRQELFVRGQEPKKSTEGRTKVFIDKTTNDLAKPGQVENVEERMEIVVTDALNNKYCVTCPQPTPTPTP